MYTEVKEDANQTYEFDFEFIRKLLKRQPIYEGEDIDFILDEEKDLLPAFKEEASPISREMMAYPVKSREDFYKAIKLYPPDENMKAELLNIDGRNELKAQSLKLYLKGRFNNGIRILDVVITRKTPLKARVLLSIKNPEEIYKEARRFGLLPAQKQGQFQSPTSWINNSAIGIYYDIETGKGRVGSRKFKFKSKHPAFAVFAEMYQNLGKRIPKTDVLRLCGYKEVANNALERLDDRPNPKSEYYSSISYFTNHIAKFIRTKTGLNTEQIVHNSGDLTLKGVAMAKSPK